MDSKIKYNVNIAKRFRGYFPIIVDVETGGLHAKTDALLEIAAVSINCDNNGKFYVAESCHFHVEAFHGSKIYADSLAINKIVPDHPFRFAVPELKAFQDIFKFISNILKQTHCTRAVLVGHNAWFDLSFVNAAIKRIRIKNNLFHAFTCFDTATMSAIAYGQTVLAEALKKANIPFDPKSHHSAIYDASQTAELFCKIINEKSWPRS